MNLPLSLRMRRRHSGPLCGGTFQAVFGLRALKGTSLSKFNFQFSGGLILICMDLKTCACRAAKAEGLLHPEDYLD